MQSEIGNVSVAKKHKRPLWQAIIWVGIAMCAGVMLAHAVVDYIAFPLDSAEIAMGLWVLYTSAALFPLLIVYGICFGATYLRTRLLHSVVPVVIASVPTMIYIVLVIQLFVNPTEIKVRVGESGVNLTPMHMLWGTSLIALDLSILFIPVFLIDWFIAAWYKQSRSKVLPLT
jgi:hypothetical protein